MESLNTQPNMFEMVGIPELKEGDYKNHPNIVNTTIGFSEPEIPSQLIKTTSESEIPLSIEDIIENLKILSDILGRKVDQLINSKKSHTLTIYTSDVLMRYIVQFMALLVEKEYMSPLSKTTLLQKPNDRPTNLKQNPPEPLIKSDQYPEGTIICNPSDLLNPESVYNKFKQSLKEDFPKAGGVLIQCSASNIKDTERNKISAQIGKSAAEDEEIFVSGGSGMPDSAMDVSSLAYLLNGGKKWVAVLTPEIYNKEQVAMQKLEQYKDQIQIIMAPDWDTRIRVMRDIANFNNNAEIEISHGGLGTLQELLILTQLSLEDIKNLKEKKGVENCIIPPKINISDYGFWKSFIVGPLNMIGVKPTLEYPDESDEIITHEIITFNQVEVAA